MTYFVDRGCENNHLNVASCDVRKNKYIFLKSETSIHTLSEHGHPEVL